MYDGAWEKSTIIKMGKSMQSDEGTERREIDQKRIRFDTGVNIAHILTTIGMLVMLFNWGSGINANLAVQASEISNIKEDRQRARAELMAALQEINRKLDKIQP